MENTSAFTSANGAGAHVWSIITKHFGILNMVLLARMYIPQSQKANFHIPFHFKQLARIGEIISEIVENGKHLPSGEEEG